VTGNKRAGSMGPALASFSGKGDAKTFVNQYGGQILRFGQMTPETVVLDGGVVHDERM
jgi:copper chaperone NosL